MQDQSPPLPYIVEDRGYETPCWIWQGARHRLGYAVQNRKGEPKFVHIAQYIGHHGPVPQRYVVDHMCNQKPCINPSHLQAITHTDNIRRCSHTILDLEKVAVIRALRNEVPGVELARRFGVTKHCISKVQQNKIWIDPDYQPTPLTNRKKPNTSLTWDAVNEIRRLRGLETQAAVAKRFGVTVSTISEIQCGRRWKAPDDQATR